MNFRVSVARDAEKILDRLDRPTERRIRDRFIQLAADLLEEALETLGRSEGLIQLNRLKRRT